VTNDIVSHVKTMIKHWQTSGRCHLVISRADFFIIWLSHLAGSPWETQESSWQLKWPKFWTLMLTCDLFVLANLFVQIRHKWAWYHSIRNLQ